MEEAPTLKAKGCGYKVAVGDEELLKLHEDICPLCKDTAAIRRKLRLERRKTKEE